MKFNKYLIISLVLILIVLSLYFINYLFTDKSKIYKNNIEKNMIINESFTNNTNSNIDDQLSNSQNEYNNLITNGNFENGKDCKNHTSQSGYNKIVMIKNPGNSSYALEQKKTDTLTYYEIICDNEKNSKYNLYFWLSIKDNNIEELNLEKLIKISIQNEDFSNYIPKLNYNIVQKVILSQENDNIWYLIKYNFISSNTTQDKMHLYLNYETNLQFNSYFFTNISLYRVLIDAENFIYNNKLIAYVDGYHYESNTPTFHDLSGNGNDLFWSTIPIADYTIGSLNMLNSKLVGFPSHKLSNSNFTIILCINKNYQNTASDNYVDNMEGNLGIDENTLNEMFLISLPGNDRYSFEIKIKDNHLILLNGSNSFKSKNEVILYNKSIITITYDKNKIVIYHDGIPIISESVNKIYFSNDNLVINRNKNLDYNIYSLLFYNRVIGKKELDNIRNYFISNQDKNFNVPDINTHHMNNNLNYESIDNYNSLYKPFNKKSSTNYQYNNVFIDTFDNQNYKVKEAYNKSCTTDCDTLCSPFKNNKKNYDQCISNCKNVLPTCQNFCDEENNENSVYCNNNIDNNNNTNIYSGCPKIYKKYGKYIAYISPHSEYAQKLNFSGERSYGANLSKARYTYNLNFPNCPTPAELIPGNTDKNYIETCPYTINEANPCHMSVCAGVNWNVKNYKDLKVNKKCKKVISNYCQLNFDVDDNCSCWNPTNKNDPKCIEFRRYFEDPNDYCSPNQFKIEEHPDFNKYIKKDNIPCWGCNLNE